ncbi:MAG TPA: DUF885 family protein, partial [Gemmatimonadaceae bacterium]|nr:DUF885 family protein [Gemmatimonadaceae bacterium]
LHHLAGAGDVVHARHAGDPPPARPGQRELGPKFDIRAFHDRILENGAVPLPLLREAVGRWVERTPQ